MSLDCVHFAPPKAVHVERVHNSEGLLVQLHFPGVIQSNPLIPQFPHRKRRLFGCLLLSKHSSSCFQSTWFKLIDDKTPSGVMKSGEWIPMQPEKKPANSDMWLRIFRHRISIMLIPLKQEKNSMLYSNRSRISSSEVLPITRYYYWDSGRLSQALNPQKSEILITNDYISLRLYANGELWSARDIELLQNIAQKEEVGGESKDSLKLPQNSGDGPIQEGEFKCAQNNAISDLSAVEHTEKLKNMEEEEEEGEGNADRISLDTNTHPIEHYELRSTMEGRESTGKNSMIEECHGELLL